MSKQISIAVALAAAAVTALAFAAMKMPREEAGNSGPVGGAPPPSLSTGSGSDAVRYVVVYREAPLSAYRGQSGYLPAPARQQAGPAGRGRLDVHGNGARAYLDHLERLQARHEAAIGRALGRRLHVERRLRHALNGAVVRLSAAEAARVAQRPEVLLVEPYREYAQAGDTGPALLGAPALWNAVPTSFRGDGVVIGVIDSGINFGSPSFAGVGAANHQHLNPLGSGNYLGSCAPGGVDEGRCNDKLIGGYDFVCGAPGNFCGISTVREEPGFGDSQGHGTQVASVAAGNARTVQYKGRDVAISGVAPHANLIAYDACYSVASTGQGYCPGVSVVAAVDQAVADGIVDVLNLSITGGLEPWGEAVSLALLNATEAGIYVAVPAGNLGSEAGKVEHLEPWVATTASAQHGRGEFASLLQVTGPAPVPAAVQTIVLGESSTGVALTAAIGASTPLRASPGINTGADGCSAFPSGTFQGAIAIMRRGTCTFSIKVNNAAAAGAVAVVMANNAPGTFAPTYPGTTIPAFHVSAADGTQLRDFAMAQASATAGIGYPATPIPNTPDVLAGSSGRGPAGRFSVLKPDLTAPGVLVLAATSGTAISGSESAVALANGTSIAAAHNAGAAALLRQARPQWSAAELKSALMMTAKPEVFLPDEYTPGNAHAIGGGRIRVDQAWSAGLVLDETAANFRAANPANGGDPANLNLASLAQAKCPDSCSFTRVFRNTSANAQTWNLVLHGFPGTVAPTQFTLTPGASQAVLVTIDSSGVPKDNSWRHGRLELSSGSGSTQAVLRLPIAVAVPPPAIAFNPAQVSLSVAAGSNATVPFRVENRGGSSLLYQFQLGGTALRTLVDTSASPIAYGDVSTIFTDPNLNPPAAFAAEDFTLTETTRIGTVLVRGANSGGSPLANVAMMLGWSVYPDVNGNPSGHPMTVGNPPAVWNFSTASMTAPGLRLKGSDIGLDLAAANQTLDLAPGRYWLVPYVRTAQATQWIWQQSNSAGSNGYRTMRPGFYNWRNGLPGPGGTGLAWRVETRHTCGASWILTTLGSGQVGIGNGDDHDVTVVSNGLAPGHYVGYVCVSSDDPERPNSALRVELTVTP